MYYFCTTYVTITSIDLARFGRMELSMAEKSLLIVKVAAKNKCAKIVKERRFV